MNPAEGLILPAFLVFCRVGACFMLMPGLSSARLPSQIRLFLALGVSLALTPLVAPQITPAIDGKPLADLLLAIGGELAAGGVIGLLARIFILALQALATAAAQSVGLATPAGMVIEDEGQLPEIITLISLSAVTLLFATGQHIEMIRALVESYGRIPPGAPLESGAALGLALDRLGETFLLALRLASPFLIYSAIVNFAVGLTNKLTPTIPVFFIAMPFVTFGGLLLLYATIGDMLSAFLDAFTTWLATG